MTEENSLPELRFPTDSRPWRHLDFRLTCLWLMVLFGLWAIQNERTGFDLLRMVLIFLGMTAAFSFVFSLIPLKPIIILAGGELVIRRPGLIKPREWKFAVSEIECVEIYGPAGRRYWRVRLKGHDPVDIPPVHDAFINKSLTDFMQGELSKHMHVLVKKPPSLMAEVRGDFD